MTLPDLLAHAATLSAPLDLTDLGPLRARVFGRLRASGWTPSTDDRGRKLLHSESDEALLQALVHGDADAFDALFDRHAAKLNGSARRWLQPADAADAVQDAFIALFTRAKTLLAKEEVNVGGYLFATLRNKVCDTLANREVPVADVAMDASSTEDDALAAALRREDTERLVRALERVCNPLEQDVVIASRDDRAGAEVAGELGITEGHVRVVRHRALAKLRAALGEDEA